MRQQSQQQQMESIRRHAEHKGNSHETRAAIITQAQMLDSQSQPSQFFYNSTIQHATAVTKALKANFTWTATSLVAPADKAAQSVAPAQTQPGQEEAKTTHQLSQDRPQVWYLETNLITFASNVLKVYALPSGSDDKSGANSAVDLRLSTQFNGRILDVIRVPTEPFLEEEKVTGTQNSRKRRDNGAAGGSMQPSARDMRVNRRKQRVMIDTTEGKSEEPNPTPQAAAHEVHQEEEPAPDYLFIILQNFTVALVAYNRRDHKIDVVSRGNISEKVLHDQKEAPYPIFLGQTGKFIALMLYHNILKVIPLVLRDDPNHPHIMSLTHATAVRICHSNVMQVIPLFQEGSVEQPTFGVVYQRTDHVRVPGLVGPPALQIKIELEKQLFDLDRRDLTPHEKNGGKLEFASNSIYRVESMPFGGFLAFDIDTVSYYRGDSLSNAGAYHEQLKSVHTVSAFCQVDEYDIGKRATKSGAPFIRYLFATEAGELFMLAMHIETLNAVLSGQGLDQNDSLLTIEFFAQKLTFCSSLVYLDDSLVFYSSKEGDSYILRICAEHQGSQDQPYVAIEQKFTSLAPVMDLQLARPEQVNGEQSELVVVGGWNHQTNMNLVKQGVGLRSLKSFESVLPANMVQSFHTPSKSDLIFLQVYGYDRLVGLKATQQQISALQATAENGLQIRLDGFDAAFHLEIPRNGEILTIDKVVIGLETETMQTAEVEAGEGHEGEKMVIDQEEVKQDAESIEAIVFTTDASIKVYKLDQSAESGINLTLLCEQKAAQGTKMTLAKISNDANRVIVASTGGRLAQFKIVAKGQEGGAPPVVSIVQESVIELGSEVSALTLAQDSDMIDLIYVTLYDAPHYSLNVLSQADPATSKSIIKLLARIPLTSILAMPQTKKFYQHQLVKNGQVFDQFNQGLKQDLKPEILQDLPASVAQAVSPAGEQPASDQKMDVDKEVVAGDSQGVERANTTSSEIAFRFNCTAACSIEHLTTKSQQTDTVLVGFADGKLLQICVDLAHLKDVLDEECAAFLDFQAYVETRLNVQDGAEGHEDLNVASLGPFWGSQVSFVATTLPKMRKIKMDHQNTQGSAVEAVIACSDRPVVFYEANDSIEMHYLAYKEVRDIACVTLDESRSLLLYEDIRGVLHLSESDSLRRLQVQRMVFKMQITKTLLVPSTDSIVVLLEQPNMDYIDTSRQACNVVALVSRSTMRTQAIYRLQKREIANCAYPIKGLARAGTSKQDKVKWLLIGTAFLNPEETIPSMGRIILLDAQTMDLVQEFPTAGSVQSILVTNQDKFLLLGVNNQVQAYDFGTFLPSLRVNTRTVSKLGKFELLCQKSSGTFIQSIVKLAAPGSEKRQTDVAESIIVGDMTGRGVSTFELKECRLNQVKLVESASSHISLWVNSIVALSESQFIVFDHEGNLFIFQKNLYPTCVEEKLKLKLKASYCVGEQVQAAAFGSLRSSGTSDAISLDQQRAMTDEQILQGAKVRSKKQSYVNGRKQSRDLSRADAEMVGANADNQQIEDSKEDDQAVIVTRGTVAKQNQQAQDVAILAELCDPANFGKILKDVDFARRFATKTLEEMFIMQAHKCSIVYGTTDGSLGSLFQIPPKVYLLLQLLQHEMDSHTYVDLVQQKRSEYRAVKQTPATQTELQLGKTMLNGIIDGDLVEVYLDLPKNKKLEYAKGMLGLGGRADEEFTELLTQIVSLMKKTH